MSYSVGDLFPIVDIKDRSRYNFIRYKGKEFAYDLRDNLLIYLFKDDEDIENMGKDKAPYRELDAVGLSLDNWRNRETRNEYLDEYIAELEMETSAAAQDFIQNELPMLQRLGQVEDVDSELIPMDPDGTVELCEDESRSLKDFMNEYELTKEMVDTLREFYKSSENTYFPELGFVDWLYEFRKLENGTLYCDVLEDFIDLSENIDTDTSIKYYGLMTYTAGDAGMESDIFDLLGVVTCDSKESAEKYFNDTQPDRPTDAYVAEIDEDTYHNFVGITESYEDDFDDDELADIYGGDRNYCPDCGSSNYHDGKCYSCNTEGSTGDEPLMEDLVTDPEEVTLFKSNVQSADNIDDIQDLIYSLSDGVAEVNAQEAFDTNELNSLQTLKDAVITAIDVYLEDNEWLGEELDPNTDDSEEVILVEEINDNSLVQYAFPLLTDRDKSRLKSYGLVLDDESDEDSYVSGSYRDIKDFADKYLGYELVDGYLTVLESKSITEDKKYQLRYKSGTAADMNYYPIISDNDEYVEFKNLMWTDRDEKIIRVDKTTNKAFYKKSGKEFGYLDDSSSKNLNETYWINNDEVMSEVDRLSSELEYSNWNYYGDKNTGSTYYKFYTRRVNNRAVAKAIVYSHTIEPTVIDVTVDQIIGKEPLDSVDSLRKDLGNILLPKSEDLDLELDENEVDTFTVSFDIELRKDTKTSEEVERMIQSIVNKYSKGTVVGIMEVHKQE